MTFWCGITCVFVCMPGDVVSPKISWCFLNCQDFSTWCYPRDVVGSLGLHLGGSFQVTPTPLPRWSIHNLLVVNYTLDVAPSQDSSGKWRFRLGFPTKNVIIHVVTVNVRGPYPNYTSIPRAGLFFCGPKPWDVYFTKKRKKQTKAKQNKVKPTNNQPTNQPTNKQTNKQTNQPTNQPNKQQPSQFSWCFFLCRTKQPPTQPPQLQLTEAPPNLRRKPGVLGMEAPQMDDRITVVPPVFLLELKMNGCGTLVVGFFRITMVPFGLKHWFLNLTFCWLLAVLLLHQKLNGTESQRTPWKVSCDRAFFDTQV